jgi:hypothetical protein
MAELTIQKTTKPAPHEKAHEKPHEKPAAHEDPSAAFQSALTRLVEDTVERVLAKGHSAKPAESEDIKKTVTEAVGSVLLETNLVERILDRHLKARPAAAAAAGGASADFADLRVTVQKEMRNFVTSQEFKELMEEKFRAITMYLRSDVVPKVVRETLARA